ncbi:zinc-binding protein A33-like isoform X2 [Protopterus annectens]|uniref:zinc-binding protein A33-like isoform X2 n=1 Tax=Protopterus annectens TaxID=7888 RepID=UPI001CFAE8A1|nr:zinc-binding protein A33-like isoform X2 [Protopterus annectens]
MQETDCQDKEQMQNMCATNGGTEQCCGEHRRGLKLFCREDEAFICVLCVPRHSCHSFVLLHEAVSVYKEKLKTSLSSLELKVRDLKDLQTKNETEFQEIQERAVNLEKYIAEEFVKLHQFLHDKEQKLIYQLNSKASEILKESKENLECFKTGFTEIHSAASDTNLEIKKEVDILEERNDTDYLTTTEESVSGDTSKHGKHKANGVLSEHAVNLEKYIAEEFVKLHQFLHGEEQKLIYQLNSKASEILKEREEKFEWFKTGVTEIHSAASDTNLEIKKEVDVLEERNDTDYLATTEESGLGDTSEHGKHKANGVLSAPESFEDVAVTFSAEEMKMLTKQEKELHKEVKLENYETLVSAGYKIPPEALLVLLKEDNAELQVNDKKAINRTEHKNNFKEKPDSK